MAQWASGYLEGALGIDKVWGDIFGVALFSVMLGLGRTLYSKIGKNTERVLFLGAIGAFLCYTTAALSGIAVIGLLACAFTGFCVSMLWPGSLIVASKHFPDGGVFIFAMMAAGGDLGASVGPQLIGIITDAVAASGAFANIAPGISPEQLGMKIGMLVAAIFPLCAIFIYKKLSKQTNFKK
jgi:MFS family permease